jgi:adenosylcobinamide kinase/adenosylcobinamide-phosphate guanylyltransferase
MTPPLCLILGGVRSGKSSFAEKLAQDMGEPTLYVATGLPIDQEMEQRIRRHRESRPAHWKTLEEPINLAAGIETELGSMATPSVVLVDSLDLWVANWLLEHQSKEPGAVEDSVICAIDRLLSMACRTPAAYFLVSSEVGLSLVPPESLGRRFQDLLGLVNQRVAAAADRVYLVVAGIPKQIKGSSGA